MNKIFVKTKSAAYISLAVSLGITYKLYTTVDRILSKAEQSQTQLTLRDSLILTFCFPTGIHMVFKINEILSLIDCEEFKQLPFIYKVIKL